MKFERRLERLEKHLVKTDFDPKLDVEVTEWFKSHPGFHPFTQPENISDPGMPEYLRKAFSSRIRHFLSKNNLPYDLKGISEIWESLYP